MPNHVESGKRVMEYIAEEINRQTFVNLMAQYRPHYKAKSEDFYEAINRPITPGEYESVVGHARDVGLERLTLDWPR